MTLYKLDSVVILQQNKRLRFSHLMYLLFENKDRNWNLFCPLQLGTPFPLISGSVRNVCHVFCLCLHH
jgi:hypothetical protein